MSSESATKRLSGRVVIVTGGGKGIGRAEALLFAQHGARVVVNDIGFDGEVGRAATVVQEVAGAGGEAVPALHDIATFDGARQVVEMAISSFGRLDVVLNNAGLRAQNLISEITEAEYERVLNSHLKATFGTIKFAAPIFVKQGSGVILNTSSEAGIGMPFNAAYAAAKEGITGLTRTVARELGSHGVRCNQIRPRASTSRDAEYVERQTQFAAIRDSLGPYRLGSRGDVNRPSLPEHVAVLAVWLCTDAAANVNGCDFQVAGDEIGLWTEPQLARTAVLPGGWDLDSLDERMAESITHGLVNRFSPPAGEAAPV